MHEYVRLLPLVGSTRAAELAGISRERVRQVKELLPDFAEAIAPHARAAGQSGSNLIRSRTEQILSALQSGLTMQEALRKVGLTWQKFYDDRASVPAATLSWMVDLVVENIGSRLSKEQREAVVGRLEQGLLLGPACDQAGVSVDVVLSETQSNLPWRARLSAAMQTGANRWVAASELAGVGGLDAARSGQLPAEPVSLYAAAAYLSTVWKSLLTPRIIRQWSDHGQMIGLIVRGRRAYDPTYLEWFASAHTAVNQRLAPVQA